MPGAADADGCVIDQHLAAPDLGGVFAYDEPQANAGLVAAIAELWSWTANIGHSDTLCDGLAETLSRSEGLRGDLLDAPVGAGCAARRSWRGSRILAYPLTIGVWTVNPLG